MNTVESRGVSFDMLGLALLIVCAVAAVDVAWAEALGSSFRQETLAAMVCVAMLMMAAALHLGNDRFTTLASGSLSWWSPGRPCGCSTTSPSR